MCTDVAPMMMVHHGLVIRLIITILSGQLHHFAWSFAYQRSHNTASFSSTPPSARPTPIVSSWSNDINNNYLHHRRCWQSSKINSANNAEEYDDNDDILPPLFIDRTNDSVTHQRQILEETKLDEVIPQSLSNSIDRVKKKIFQPTNYGSVNSYITNDELLKRIVQEGINYQQRYTQQQQQQQQQSKLNQSDTDAPMILQYQRLEKVPGCIATVYLQTTLIPLTTDDDLSSSSDSSSSTASNDMTKYRVLLSGTADALLSRGLLAILADIFSNGRSMMDAADNSSTAIVSTITTTHDSRSSSIITAEQVLNINPDMITTQLGLSSILSRGRNDGVASMVRVIQQQIKSLILEKIENENNNNITTTQQQRRPTVAMLLSGGVDSSVALHLLLQQNYNVTAFYLRIWLEDELSHLGECPWEDDIANCVAVCNHQSTAPTDGQQQQHVPLVIVSLGTEYRDTVIQYTIDEAKRGRTPNPDIMCNSRVKFGCFLEYIHQQQQDNAMDFDYIASGHYAQLIDADADDDDDDKDLLLSTTYDHGGAMQQQKQQKKKKKKRRLLLRAPDPIKDQSYFLCTLTQKQLTNVLFPIGSYTKSEVRELATQFQLPNRNRPDSQGLCFLGKVKFDTFIASYLGTQPGDVIDAFTGESIGTHNGLWYHTVGQRKGIGKVISPLATARGPWYVVAKDQGRNLVYVSNRYDEDEFVVPRCEFEVEDVTWISGQIPKEMYNTTQMNNGAQWNVVRMDYKIRHGPRIVSGTFELINDVGSCGYICLDEKDGGLAPGQYVVFYRVDSMECLGAGVISERHWTTFLKMYDEDVVVASGGG
jgi:tRNA-specific 2-thiouridylase